MCLKKGKSEKRKKIFGRSLLLPFSSCIFWRITKSKFHATSTNYLGKFRLIIELTLVRDKRERERRRFASVITLTLILFMLSISTFLLGWGGALQPQSLQMVGVCSEAGSWRFARF